MIIIGFSSKTSKTLPRLICRHFKHCVVIIKIHNKFVLHQFVKRRTIAQITITERGIAQLKSNGWVFIYLKLPPQYFDKNKWTCVNYAKSAIGLNNLWIQTPNSLYKYLQKNLT